MAITPNTTFTAGEILTADQMNRLPWGIIAKAERTTDQTGISTLADITGISVTWTADSTRVYRTTLWTPNLEQKTTTGNAKVVIADGANVQKTQALSTGGARFFALSAEIIETGLSGSTTRKGRAETSFGTLDVLGNAAYPMFIVVEDLGKA